MPAAQQKSIANGKSKYLQDGEDIRFGAARGAFVGSGNAVVTKLRALKADETFAKAGLQIVEAPPEAIKRVARAQAKAPKAGTAASV